jgi:RNA polymerase sigma-70 factor (ECF subfamily)
VGAARRRNQDQQDSQTLGDLLYGDEVKIPVSESDWVQVIRSIAAGDQLALHSLYERMHRLVFTLILRITKDPHTAEELTLDIFHDVWKRAGGYDPAGGSVVGWIMNQARSRAIDRLRFEQRKKRVNVNGDRPPVLDALQGPQEAYHLEEQARLLRNALSVLTPEERQVIEIAFFSERTYLEVAEELNQPLGTVKTRIRSGLGKLREKLSRTLGNS